LLLWLLVATGCGQRGPLYLPGEEVPEATEEGLPEPTTVEILEGTPEGIEETQTEQPAQP
jgi:predicted small lipoprotein YifL